MRYRWFFSFFAFLGLMLQGCSWSNGGESELAINDESRWYECKAGSNGWDCGNAAASNTQSSIEIDEEGSSHLVVDETPVQSSEIPPQDSFNETQLSDAINDQPLLNIKDSVDADRANYSIQLAAFKEQDRLQSYVLDKDLADLELVSKQEDRDGSLWWTLLFGEFDQFDDALKAQQQLEAEYGLTDSWIRPLD